MANKVWNNLLASWADPQNWSPSGAPLSSDTLIFNEVGNRLPLNDLGDGLQFDLQLNGSGYDIQGDSVTLSGPTALVATQASGNNQIGMDLLLDGAATVAVDSSLATLTLDGAVSTPESGSLTKTGAGTLILTGFSTGFLTSINAGVVQVDGGLGAISLVGGTLQGTGSVGDITASVTGGTVSPGNSPAILSSGSVVFNAATTFVVELDGATVGTGYDQLNVAGSVDLGGASLSTSLGFVPGSTDSFTIVSNDGTDPIFGTFAGLPQGSVFSRNGTQFLVDYFGGDGNDVVLSVNVPPVARDDVYSLPADSILSVPPTGVLLNDSADPNGNPIVPVLVAGPSNGTLSLFTDGSFTYTPAPGFSGLDTFTYQDSDGNQLSNIATVRLFVNATNLPPVVRDDSYSATADTPLVIAGPGVLGNDYSPQGGALTAELLANATSGVVVLNANGSFTYTPSTGFVGTDTFTYRARDILGLGSSDNPAATVSINVGVLNIAPVAVDDAFSTSEDKTLIVAGPGVLANDTDANVSPTPDTLSAFLVDGPAHGRLDLSSTGQLTYTPDDNFFGTDTFTYRATDGQLTSNLATVTITIVAANDAPIGTDDSYVTDEGTALNVAAPGVLVNDTDLDGDALTAILVNGVQHGTLVFNANGSFLYTPTANFAGVDTFTYRASDGNPGGQSDLVTVTITVTLVNVPPVAVDDVYTGNEDSPLTVAGPGVLLNDTDLDGDFLSAVLATAPTNGSVVLNSDGSFVYTPFANFSGPTDTFTYRVGDGTLFSNPATVTINVRSVTEAPIARDDAYTTLEDTTLTIAAPGIRLNDTTVDPAPVTVIVVNGPFHSSAFSVQNDGSLSYTPAAQYFGTDTFTYYLVQGNFNSNLATVTITTLAVNDTPVAVNDAYATNEDVTLVVAAPGVLLNDTDNDGDKLSAVLQAGPSFGTVALNSDGSFAYTPVANYNGLDTFTYAATDGKLFSNVATVTITVRPVNDAPVAINDNFMVMQDQKLSVVAPGILANDLDLEGSALTAVLVNPPLNGVLSLAADGGFLYTPNLGYSGVETFTYRANDAGLSSNLATVTILVSAVPTQTVQLDPFSDTGVSPTDRVTFDNTPTFFGTASPNLMVQLLYQSVGSAASPVVIAGTVADAAGNYRITSPTLLDGVYSFFVTSTRGDGISSGLVNAGPLTIDTVGPKITQAVLDPRTGQVYVTYQDDRSGMNVASIGNVRNYTLTRRTVPNPRQFVITGARPLPGSGPTAPQTVVLTSGRGKPIPHGRYQFSVGAAGVTDVAGNQLDGDFNGALPSGNGTQGGDFNAQFLNGNRRRTGATPTSQFIPVLTRVRKLSTTPHQKAPRLAARPAPRHPAGPIDLNNLFQ